MKYLSLALGLFLLAGCAFPARVISSSPRTVVIRSVDGIAKAQPLAEAECKKYDRQFARLSGTQPSEFVFDCVN